MSETRSVVATPLALGFCERADIKMTANRTSLKRVSQPEEVGKVIAFLLSDDSSYITGSIVNVDGGWTVSTPVDYAFSS
jgi:NAD(P)-dependent dehydrogenase (short-subunit alcohol dehydrogenase family)